MTGTALNADGSPMDLGLVEQRIINPALIQTEVGRRDVRTVLGDGLEARPGVPGGWIAVYDQYSDATDDVIVAGETRGMSWQATAPNGDRLGITINEAGITGGAMPGCPAGSSYAVTGSSRPAVTKAMKDAGTALEISGVADRATAVRVTLSDGGSVSNDATVDAALSGVAGAQTWRATITADQLARLADGPLTASGSYTVDGTPI